MQKRYVEFWTKGGALQRSSEAPLEPVFPKRATQAELDEDAAYLAQFTSAVVDYDDGWIWDPAQTLYVVPPPPAPVLEVTKARFLGRFTDAELIAFEMLKAQATQDGASARVLQIRFDNAPDGIVRFTSDDTIKGVNSLAALGVIDPARVADLLAPEVVK